MDHLTTQLTSPAPTPLLNLPVIDAMSQSTVGAAATAVPAAFDLARIDTPAAAEAGHEIELTYNDKPTGWFVLVRGEYSATVKKWQVGIGNKFRLKEWKDKRASKNDGPSLMTDEDMEVGLRGAAVRVAGLRGVVFNGQPFPANEANAYELVRRHPPFADQILEASADAANFMKGQ